MVRQISIPMTFAACLAQLAAVSGPGLPRRFNRKRSGDYVTRLFSLSAALTALVFVKFPADGQWRMLRQLAATRRAFPKIRLYNIFRNLIDGARPELVRLHHQHRVVAKPRSRRAK